MNDRELHNLARTTCTPKEYDAWRLSTAGMSLRRIALDLGISHTAVRQRIQRAQTKLQHALQKEAA